MQMTAQSIWWPRLATFLLALLAAASVGYWGLKLSESSSASTVPPAFQGGTAPVADATAVAHMLGGGLQAAAPVENAPARFVLAGIVTEGRHAGAALISVDGKPARPFRVGAKVEEGLVLVSVAPRAAMLGGSTDAPPTMTLELPLRKP